MVAGATAGAAGRVIWGFSGVAGVAALAVERSALRPWDHICEAHPPANQTRLPQLGRWVAGGDVVGCYAGSTSGGEGSRYEVGQRRHDVSRVLGLPL